MPRFSIVLVHDPSRHTHDELRRAVASLVDQTYQDFEIVAYHAGPLAENWPRMSIPFRCDAAPGAESADTLRDTGIRQAGGDYIVHMDSGGLLYRHALETISQAIDRPNWLFLPNGEPFDNPDLIVFGIIARGFQRLHDRVVRFPNNPECQLILSGNPPRVSFIDTLQLVMRRSLWLADGGWHLRGPSAAGRLYEALAAKHRYRCTETILGERCDDLIG